MVAAEGFFEGEVSVGFETTATAEGTVDREVSGGVGVLKVRGVLGVFETVVARREAGLFVAQELESFQIVFENL